VSSTWSEEVKVCCPYDTAFERSARRPSARGTRWTTTTQQQPPDGEGKTAGVQKPLLCGEGRPVGRLQRHDGSVIREVESGMKKELTAETYRTCH
jgi:hypothetical protein